MDLSILKMKIQNSGHSNKSRISHKKSKEAKDVKLSNINLDLLIQEYSDCTGSTAGENCKVPSDFYKEPAKIEPFKKSKVHIFFQNKMLRPSSSEERHLSKSVRRVAPPRRQKPTNGISFSELVGGRKVPNRRHSEHAQSPFFQNENKVVRSNRSFSTTIWRPKTTRPETWFRWSERTFFAGESLVGTRGNARPEPGAAREQTQRIPEKVDSAFRLTSSRNFMNRLRNTFGKKSDPARGTIWGMGPIDRRKRGQVRQPERRRRRLRAANQEEHFGNSLRGEQHAECFS